MERITICTKIVDGKLVFETIREELPLFQRTGDLTETLGQYSGTISSNIKRRNSKKIEKPEEGPTYSPDSIMY